MKEDWIEQQRRKLEGHRKTPPAGLWEGICEQIELRPKPVRQSQTSWSLYWVAAAAVLAIVGFFMVYQFPSEPEKSLASINSEPSIRPKSSISSESFSSPQPSISPEPSVSSGMSGSSEHALLQTAEKETHSDADMPQQFQIDTDTLQQTESSPVPADPVTHNYSHYEGNHTSYAPSPTSQLDKWSFGVNASSGLLAANTSQRTRAASLIDIDKSGYTAGIVKEIEDVSEHHLPIRFGLSVNYQLTPFLALNSGLSYTYLYSEFKSFNFNFDQKLHYLGIPFGVTWQLWSVNHFRFYVSGGMMLEKCVSAEIDGSSVSEKPWQLSVEAAAGAEYTFTRRLGVYIEPSLGYYFNDGSPLEHYYNEHPWTPSLEFGLRIHLKK